MIDNDRSVAWRQIVDLASVIFVVTFFVCLIGAWLCAQLMANDDGTVPLHTTIFGYLPATLEIAFLDFIPTIFGMFWLVFRYANKYPFIKSWQFKILIAFGPVAIMLLGRFFHEIFGL